MSLYRFDFDTSAKDYGRHRRGMVAFELVEVEQMDLEIGLEV